jgi:hypothetical protein
MQLFYALHIFVKRDEIRLAHDEVVVHLGYIGIDFGHDGAVPGDSSLLSMIGGR